MPEDKKVWEVSIKDGILSCTIDLKVLDGVTIALGVADRIKSLVLSMEAKEQMRKQMEAAMKDKTMGIIKPSIVPNGGHA